MAAVHCASVTNTRRAPSFRSISPLDVLRRAGDRCTVIIAPHPDDETLGCGRLLAHAARRGVSVAVIVLTDGDASHLASKRWPPAALGRLRIGEMKRALARLGAGDAPIRRLGWPDGQVSTHGRMRQLATYLLSLNAGIVIFSSNADHHPDHQAAFRLARAATHRLGLLLVSYAVWSRANTAPAIIGRHRDAKRWAINAHRSQVGGYIADDPAGFRLAPRILACLVDGTEQLQSRTR